MNRWTLFALLFSVAVNIAVVGTLLYFWQTNGGRGDEARQPEPSRQRDLLWLSAPQVPAKAARKIDSLRRDYHDQLFILRASIDSEREAIIAHLMGNQVNRDSLEAIISELTAKQIAAERLTIDHLLMIKPLLPPEEWRLFIRDLRPHRQRRIIKIHEGDSTKILYDEQEIDENIFQFETDDVSRLKK